MLLTLSVRFFGRQQHELLHVVSYVGYCVQRIHLRDNLSRLYNS